MKIAMCGSVLLVSSKSYNLHRLFLLNKSCLKNLYSGVQNDTTHPHVTNVEIFSRIPSTEISPNIEIIVLDDSGNDISCWYTFSSLCCQEPKINYNLFISKPLTIFPIKFFSKNDQLIHAWIFPLIVNYTCTRIQDVNNLNIPWKYFHNIPLHFSILPNHIDIHVITFILQLIQMKVG